jgi:hypothetical protein
VTDSKGRFVFRRLPASTRYAIHATKSGFVASGLAGPLLILPGSRFPLDEGEWISDADFVMWRLSSISGRVLDERGEPVVGVVVRVLLRVPVAGVTQLASGPMGRTDDRGLYRIPGLRRGAYIVTVPSVQSAAPLSAPVDSLGSTIDARPGAAPPKPPWVDTGSARLVVGRYATPPPATPNQTPRAYPIVFFPNARSLAAAVPVDVADGEEKLGVDFILEPVPTGQISGRLTGPAAVVAGLVLRLLPEGGESLGMGSEVATSVAGSDGTFKFVAVPAGRYTIDARKTVSGIRVGGWVSTGRPPATPGFMSQLWGGKLIPSPFGPTQFETYHGTPGEDYTGRLEVTVGSLDVSDIVVALQRSATISGRVIRDDGSSVSETVRVVVEPADGSPDLGGPAGVYVGRGGQFSIDGLKAGEYFLTVGSTVKSIIAPNGDHTDRPFVATPGTDIADVVVTLARNSGSLSGEVRDRQGRSVKEAAVIVFPTDPARWVRFGLEPPRIRSVTCFGAAGYQLTRLPGGDYYAIAVRPELRDSWQAPGFLAAAAPLATRFTVNWGQTRTLSLTIREVTFR